MGQLEEDHLPQRGTGEGQCPGLVAGELRKVRFFVFCFLKIQLSTTGRVDWSMWRNGNVIKNRSRI